MELFSETLKHVATINLSERESMYEVMLSVGQTEVLDPEELPDLMSQFCRSNTILGIQFLGNKSAKKNDPFRNSEWGPEAAEAMCKKVCDLKLHKEPNVGSK
ncbi:hypothetical protein MVEG_08188 [Podila verticillata NRRL 6337]|nr:hypothetical protein MVEG_08188 [Podila verticillata NRRL 6337]